MSCMDEQQRSNASDMNHQKESSVHLLNNMKEITNYGIEVKQHMEYASF